MLVPLPTQRALRKLGRNIADARKRRRTPASILAGRASISRTTLHKIERGDAGVAMGSYATVLFALGLIDRVADLADPRQDAVGLELEAEHLPKRIRLPRKPKPADQGNAETG